MAAALAAGALVCGPGDGRRSTERHGRVVPRGTTWRSSRGCPGSLPGVMSAGIGSVPAEQTYLDITQGNRVDDALYDRDLPDCFRSLARCPNWAEIVARADDAPADIGPGAARSTRLEAGGIPAYAQQPMTAAALIAADRRGVVVTAGAGPLRRSLPRGRPGERRGAADVSRRLRGDDLLIAIAAPPPAGDRALPIGIAGRGFDGDLTSDSTRTPRLRPLHRHRAHDLGRFGLGIPDEMDGEPIRAEGSVDPAAVEDLADRMAVIPGRRRAGGDRVLPPGSRSPRSLRPLGSRAEARGRLAGALASPICRCCCSSARRSSRAARRGAARGLGRGSLAALTLRLVRGWWALAVACAITVVAYAIDVVAGSGLTSSPCSARTRSSGCASSGSATSSRR